MKKFKTLASVLLTLVFTVTGVTSCDWDASPEPEEFPLYVTYAITAGSVSFTGPDQLLTDIQTWINANQTFYDKSVNYTTGEASEFEKSDAEAVKKYEEFASKFKKCLEDDITNSLKAGKYDDAEAGTKATVQAVFYISATRAQGQQGKLKYEEVKFTYP